MKCVEELEAANRKQRLKIMELRAMLLNANQDLRTLKQENAKLQEALEQSKASNKRIKEDCRYVDYNKLQSRFFSKCEENDRLRQALTDILECSDIITAVEELARQALEGDSK